VNDPAVPATKVVLLALVIAGAWFTFSVKLWTAFEPTPFAAVKVMLKAPFVVGVPLRVAVPSPLSWKVTPFGNEPFSLMLGVGNPVVVTVNVPGAPKLKFALFALVMVGAEAGVIFTHHPPPMLDAPLAELAMANSSHVPLGAVLLKIDASVAEPSVAA
jgi:hypothetical protein